MPFSTAPMGESFDPALISPTPASVPVPSSLIASQTEPSGPSTPSTSSPPASLTTNTAPPAGLRTLTNPINFANNNRGALIAGTSCFIVVSAAIEDPSCLPQLEQLGNGLVGAVYAGGIVCIVLALDWVDERFEGVWSRAWQWMKKGWVCQNRNEAEGEVVGTTMFNGEGQSMFLFDETEEVKLAMRETKQKGPDALIQDRRSASEMMAVEPTLHAISSTASSRDVSGRLPSLSLPPRPLWRNKPSSPAPSAPDRATFPQYSVLQQGADQDPHIFSTYDFPPPAEDYHASGLLGPSPVPSRSTATEWKHFTGQGFWKRQQEIDSANKMIQSRRKIGSEETEYV